MNYNEQFITALPKGYTSWRTALADARNSTQWDKPDPIIRQAYWVDNKPELFCYSKAYMVMQAGAEEMARASDPQ